jgi:hypothetical protein
VAAGIVEDILNKRRSTPRSSDHGWTPNGNLWFGLELPRSIITTGGLRLTPFVADLVQGEWDVQLPDGTVYGHGPLLAKAVTVPHTGAAALLVFPMRAGLAIWGAFSISMAAFITRVVVQVNPWLPPSAEAGVQGGT